MAIKSPPPRATRRHDPDPPPDDTNPFVSGDPPPDDPLDDSPDFDPQEQTDPQRRGAFRVGAVRDMHDGLDPDSPINRRRAMARKMAAMEESNPFLRQRASPLPDLPPDEGPMADPNFCYRWMRHEIDGKPDPKNIHEPVNEMLATEFVTAAMLPRRYQQQLTGFSQVSGAHGGHITYRDLIAVRSPRKLVTQKRAADQIMARRAIMETKQSYREGFRGSESRPYIEADSPDFDDHSNREPV